MELSVGLVLGVGVGGGRGEGGLRFCLVLIHLKHNLLDFDFKLSLINLLSSSLFAIRLRWPHASVTPRGSMAFTWTVYTL